MILTASTIEAKNLNDNNSFVELQSNNWGKQCGWGWLCDFTVNMYCETSLFFFSETLYQVPSPVHILIIPGTVHRCSAEYRTITLVEWVSVMVRRGSAIQVECYTVPGTRVPLVPGARDRYLVPSVEGAVRQNNDIRNFYISRNIDFTQVIIRSRSVW